MSTAPQPDFKSEQYEFNAEQNKTINDLAGGMEMVAGLMKLLGLLFLIFFGLMLLQAIQERTKLGPVIGLGAATLICLAIGFWTSAAAGSFRRIVESKNRDVWHLMNALDKLHSMYSLLRTIIVGCLVLLLIGLALVAFDRLT